MRILIVEDEAKTADYLYHGLSEEGFVVDVARTGVDGLHLALEGEYDAIVLDVMLPQLDGWAVLSALRARRQTPVIMLTASARIDDRVRGLSDGADDYLIKPFSFLELLARLRAILRRGRAQESTQLQVGDLHIDLIKRRVVRGKTRIDLTAQEFSLLTILVRRQGEIVSKAAIASQVWDINFDTNTNVVEVAIKRLRAKIDAPFGSSLLHNIRGMGYVIEDRSAENTL